MSKTFVMLGSAFMFLAVGAGAFGSHGLSAYFSRFPELEGTYQTAVRYHMVHALGLFIVAWAEGHFSASMTTWAGYLLLLGIILFSGSLYLLVFTRASWFGAITPLGGLAFLAGWVALFLAAWRT